jgi:hypothetical protein
MTTGKRHRLRGKDKKHSMSRKWKSLPLVLAWSHASFISGVDSAATATKSRGKIELAGECFPAASDLSSYHCKRRDDGSDDSEMGSVPCIDENERWYV